MRSKTIMHMVFQSPSSSALDEPRFFPSFFWNQQLESYIEDAKQIKDTLERELILVEQNLVDNDGEWRRLLDIDLADYPRIIIDEKKRQLKADRDSLLKARARINSQLQASPSVDADTVKVALDELSRAWQTGVERRYIRPDPRFKEFFEAVPDFEPLDDDLGQLLRQTLLKVNCTITIKDRKVSVSGGLPLVYSVKEGSSLTVSRLKRDFY